MPWCPKCKNEYKDGYRVCADCGSDLVDELTQEEYKNIKISNDLLEIPNDETLELLGELDEEEHNVSNEQNGIFVKAADKADNYKASAYSLLFVGSVGLVFMILVIVGIIPLNIASNVKIISYAVMISMFVVFIVIGIKSFGDAKRYTEESKIEDAKYEELTTWFCENYTKDSIDSAIFSSADKNRSVEYDYFNRYEFIKQVLNNKAPDIDSAFAEKMIEDLYSRIYEC